MLQLACHTEISEVILVSIKAVLGIVLIASYLAVPASPHAYRSLLLSEDSARNQDSRKRLRIGIGRNHLRLVGPLPGGLSFCEGP